MNSKFWNGKRVLVTGHTGFKGSWLSLWLQKSGADVTGYALAPPSNPNLFETARIADGMTSILGDVRDLSHLQETIAQHQPEIVIHMAAQPLVRYSYQHPVETYATNVMGTVHVLEAVRQAEGIRVVVNVTSDKCYENREWVWGYRENEAMGGHDPYSNSKGCAELVAAAYRSSYFSPQTYAEHGVGLASVRAGNVIGGGDWAGDRLIPDIIRAIMAKETVVIRSPNSIRPWQHVLEPLGGYLMLAEHLWDAGEAYAEGWNFGPNDEDAKPVSWIVEQLTQLWGDNAQWKLDTQVNPHEATYLKLDCSKAKNRLKWSPKLDLATTLNWIIEWYRSYLNGDDVRQLTEQQIEQYETCGQPPV
ncbi:CDP-glucose 4,6-dehydratase [Acaryochloris thomasi RCC1774]|uniref:CDP-glucose 4,6-dehydratase n=1 Tax=Acaryochloris thomasi RCC1774 TaxID=1764569 RepID=A0A2W1JSX1_9CYAN|nr:CDP-glucose 4,6-dehydratase [Acaryochloris thomasi]PZD72994.1 CDP-glucose 4,6-dehydratase [Acaryochloris thomasi RCC1774]